MADVESLPAERIFSLDVLRGCAILGILPANIPDFGLPELGADRLYTPAGGGWREAFAYFATRFLVDYKFITLFSLLFGVGMMLLRRSCEAAGRAYAPVMIRRLLCLWCFGILHATLIWSGDILAIYAPLGLLTCWAVTWKAESLQVAALVLLGVPVAAMMLLVPVAALLPAEAPAAPAVVAPPPAAGSWADFRAGLHSGNPEFETAVFREGSFLRITALRAYTWVLRVVYCGYFGWRLAGLFLLGMAWGKDGWFVRPRESVPRLRTMTALGVAVGVPLHAASCSIEGLAWGGAGGAVLAELCQYVGSLGLAAAYAGIVGLLCSGDPVPRWLGPLAAVGRLAFTNYLGQSLLCTFFFYSYGLGYFGMLDRFQLWGVVAVVWAVQVVASPLWLKRFRMGPLEFVWRAATYAAWPQPTG